MDLTALLRAARRRWYVVLVGLLLTAVAGVGLARVVPVTYDITASILLLPPQTTKDSNGLDVAVINPFLDLGGLDVAAGVLAKALTDGETSKQILPEHSTAEYTVEKDASVSGSVLLVSVNDATPAAAKAKLSKIVDLATSKLSALQEEVAAPVQYQVRLMVITDNVEAEPNYGALLRALIILAAVGIILSGFAAALVDRLMNRRARRRAERAVAAARPRDADASEADDAAEAEAEPEDEPEAEPDPGPESEAEAEAEPEPESEAEPESERDDAVSPSSV